jgi:plasmid stabilization system protein ParE
MIYTVLWSPDAENDLAAIWLHADERSVITAVGNEIDRLLRRDAHLQGESRGADLRVVVVPPLTVDFEVNEGDRTARVLTVWMPR